MKNLYLAFLMTVAVPMAVFGAESIQDFYAAANQFYAAGDYSKAIDDYQRVLSLDSKNTGAYIGLGNSYYRLGQKEQAAGYYQKALELDPNSPQVSAILAGIRTPSQATTLTFTVPPLDSTNSQSLAAGTNLSKRFELGFIGTVGMPANGEDGFGLGGRVTGGYKLNPSVSLQATLAYLNFNYSQRSEVTLGGSTTSSSSNSHTTFFECLGGLKCRFGDPLTHPYFLVGIGISDLEYSPSSEKVYPDSIYPMVEVGTGFEFPVVDDVNFLFQVEYQAVLILSRSTTQTGAGYNYVYTINNSIFSEVPIEMGLSFNL